METLDLVPYGARLEKATKRHAREIARIMRSKDRDEAAACGFVPESACRMSLNNSLEAWAVYVEDELLCVFGVGPMNSAPGITVAWLMTSVHVDKYPLTFWRCSKVVINYLRDKHVLMVNMVHGKYIEAIRWLERLGFKIGEPQQFGSRGDLFCPATLLTQKVVLDV